MDNPNTNYENNADFLEEVGKLNVYAQTYINDKIEHTKIKVAEESVKTISTLINVLVIVTLSSISMIFLSVVGGLFLGQLLESYVLGFLIVCAFYLSLLVLYLIFKRTLIYNPLTKIIIKKIL